jgi:dTDP-4-amino-4,6-dideoxygalactose transaminase
MPSWSCSSRRTSGRASISSPLHLHPYYRDTFGHRPENFPTASAVFARIISLPIYPKLTEADAQRVTDTVTRLVRQHRR